MNSTIKIFIVFVLMCVSAAVAYSQDCNIYLQRATEFVSQKKYCDALSAYRRYSNCNADADVSTEIAMCERFCKINVMEGEEDEPVDKPELDKPPSKDNLPSKDKSSGNRTTVKPPPPDVSPSVNSKFKLGVNAGLQIPTEKEKGAKTYLFFGSGISGEYLATPHLGIGLSAGYYAYTVEGGGLKGTSYLIPVALTGRFYLSTTSIQPYAGVDVGLYTNGAKVKYQGESASESVSKFGLAPVLGFQFKLSDALALDINAKYNHIFTEVKNTGLIGINAGFVFNF